MPAALNLVAETQIDREIRQDLIIVLNKELRGFFPHSGNGEVGRTPGVNRSGQEIRIAESTLAVEWSALREHRSKGK